MSPWSQSVIQCQWTTSQKCHEIINSRLVAVISILCRQTSVFVTINCPKNVKNTIQRPIKGFFKHSTHWKLDRYTLTTRAHFQIISDTITSSFQPFSSPIPSNNIQLFVPSNIPWTKTWKRLTFLTCRWVPQALLPFS